MSVDTIPQLAKQMADWADQLAEAQERSALMPIAASMRVASRELLARAATAAAIIDLPEVPQRGLTVPDLVQTHTACSLRDEEAAAILDSSGLAFAIDADMGRMDDETGEVWTLAWYRVRKPTGTEAEDRCHHGMFFSGAGACPQCGRGAE